LRFVPSVKAVLYMKMGFSPNEACKKSLEGMLELYPNVKAAVVCLNAKGEYGAAATHGKFCYSVMDVTMRDVKVICDV
jgi:isoaspartyl peptidase/L-asparaginase-like protein (Ntn-hydrolase superfamily)